MERIKKSKLQKQLFKKYLLGFIIFQIIVISISRLSLYMLENISSENFVVAEDVYKKIDKEGVKSIQIDRSIDNDAYIEILDLDYKVKYSENSPNTINYKYSKSEMKDLFNGKIEGRKAYFLGKSLEILIVNEQAINKTSALMAVFIISLAILLLLGYVVFFNIMAKSVSSTIEKPIRSLMKGINDFKNKIYSSRISFSSDNELDDLKDTFNEMATSLESEITLREKAENTNKQLILDITHDLKTPLSNIEGYCDLLISDSKLTKDSKLKYLNIIMSNSKRTNTLMSDLFELTKIDHDKYMLQRKKIDFCEFLRRILSEYILLFENESKSYEFNIPTNSIYTFIDKSSMERAISNIINNFMKYSGNNTKITLSLEEKLSDIILIISDNGKGIEKSKCSSVFLPFFREDISRNLDTGGSGLGLAITKKIIENHNGSIDLISDINHGCKFCIVIPKLI